MPAKGQQPVIYPGFAIFCFPAGIVEIIIRVSLVAILIACLVLSAVLLGENSPITSSLQFDRYYDFILQQLTALWVIMVTGIALGLELIYFVNRFLNLRCYNNGYIVFGILDIIRYVLLVVCLLIGCAGYGQGITYATDKADDCDVDARSVGKVDEACDRLRDRATLFIVMTVLCTVAVVIVIATIVWEIIYLAAGCNNRLPVPRKDGDKNNLL